MTIKHKGISKLFTEKEIEHSLYCTGNKDALRGRKTGFTTGQALALIGRAMQQPLDSVLIQACHPLHTKHLVHCIQDLINKLGLIGFCIDKNERGFSLTYDIVH